MEVLKGKTLIPLGGMYETYDWEIWSSVEVSYGLPCKHCGQRYKRTYSRPSRPGESQRHHTSSYFVCPRVVVAKTDDGYYSSGICLDCILEAAEAGLGR